MRVTRTHLLITPVAAGILLASCVELPAHNEGARGAIELRGIFEDAIVIDIESVESDRTELITLNYVLVDAANTKRSARLDLWLEDSVDNREIPVGLFRGEGNFARLDYSERPVGWFEATYGAIVTSGNLLIDHFNYERGRLELEFSLEMAGAVSTDDEVLTLSANGFYAGPVD